MLAGLAGFLYQMQDLLRHHTGDKIDFYYTPPGVGEILLAAFSGIVATLAALGLDISKFIRPSSTRIEGDDQP